MGFRVIEGGLGKPYPEEDGATPTQRDVEREAERRLNALGYPKWRNRRALTNMPIPREIEYPAMQIRYVAEVLSGLVDIPADFRSDIYWPA